MSYDNFEVGNRIRQLRREHGLTQEELAAQLNVTDKHIRNLEKGRYGASIDLLIGMCELFGASLDYIVLGRQNPGLILKSHIKSLMSLLANIDEKL